MCGLFHGRRGGLPDGRNDKNLPLIGRGKNLENVFRFGLFAQFLNACLLFDPVIVVRHG